MGVKQNKDKIIEFKESNIEINYSIKNKILLTDLTNEEKNLLSKIPFLAKTYICSICKEIPIIKSSMFQGELEFIKICKDHKEFIKSEKISSSMILINSKYRKKNSKDLNSFAFESKKDFYDYIQSIKTYCIIKNKIIELNNGDIKKHKTFSFCENLLSIGLYGNNTRFEF